MKRIVITGASGNMGRKLTEHLRSLGTYHLTLLDISGGGDTIRCDLTRYDESWARYFENADAIIHLAADRAPTSGWKTILPLNVDLLINVYEAARQKRSRRIIFASSNWVVGGHRFGRDQVTPETEPMPINPYGAAKLFGERLGKSLSDHTGISVINLRVGYVQWTRNNRPSAEMELGEWGQMIWLSDRDYHQIMVKAIEVPGVRYATLNAASDIRGGRFNIDETRRVLGYQPQDSYRVELPPSRWLTNRMAWVRDVGVERLRGMFSPDW